MTYQLHRLSDGADGGARFLYRGFIIEQVADSQWCHFDTDYPRGVESVEWACVEIDWIYRGGFIHEHEGPGRHQGWSSCEYQLNYWG